MLKLIVALITSIVIGILLGPSFPREDQRSLALVVANTSAVLFGVLGIWAGLVFPSVLEVLSERKTDEKILEALTKEAGIFKPIVFAMATFATSTIYIYIGDMICKVSFLREYAPILQIASLACLAFIVLLSVYTLLLAIRPGADVFRLTLSRANLLMSSNAIFRKKGKADASPRDSEKINED